MRQTGLLTKVKSQSCADPPPPHWICARIFQQKQITWVPSCYSTFCARQHATAAVTDRHVQHWNGVPTEGRRAEPQPQRSVCPSPSGSPTLQHTSNISFEAPFRERGRGRGRGRRRGLPRRSGGGGPLPLPLSSGISGRRPPLPPGVSGQRLCAPSTRFASSRGRRRRRHPCEHLEHRSVRVAQQRRWRGRGRGRPHLPLVFSR